MGRHHRLDPRLLPSLSAKLITNQQVFKSWPQHPYVPWRVVSITWSDYANVALTIPVPVPSRY